MVNVNQRSPSFFTPAPFLRDAGFKQKSPDTLVGTCFFIFSAELKSVLPVRLPDKFFGNACFERLTLNQRIKTKLGSPVADDERRGIGVLRLKLAVKRLNPRYGLRIAFAVGKWLTKMCYRK